MNNAYFLIGDLLIAADTEIHSNVYKIRTSTTKEKTFICTQFHLERSHQNIRTEDPREQSDHFWARNSYV